jgi:predicted nucleotidyltransferase component of viral defense system
MTKRNFHTLGNKDKELVFISAAAKIGIPPFATEKDWWITQVLATVFELSVSGHLVFKGGTSLSKAWKLIQRFSEDIDLAIDREFLGFSGELGKNQRDRLRKTSGAYVDEVLFPELTEALKSKGFNDLEIVLVNGKDTDRDRKINIIYPNVVPTPGYIQPQIQLEIGSRSLRDPYTMISFGSLLDDIYPDQEFFQPPITVPVVNPERTFLEKVFLLHEEFQRPFEKIRVDRLSRHLYDLVKLADTEFAEKAFSDQALYETIVRHRYAFTRVGGVNYNLHQPQTINPLPIDAVADAWRQDYNTMMDQMIYELYPPNWKQLTSKMTTLRSRINALPWRFESSFPQPQS